MKRALVLALALAACGPIDAVVAYLPDAGSGGPGPGGRPCAQNPDCRPGEFCERPTCDAQVGRCMRKPVAPCDNSELKQQCGCLDVTYFSECHRRAAGDSLASPAECATDVSCDDVACRVAGASCARLTLSCGAAVGSCWVVPETCPSVGGWTACSGGEVCVDFCTAVRTQQPYRRVEHGCH